MLQFPLNNINTALVTRLSPHSTGPQNIPFNISTSIRHSGFFSPRCFSLSTPSLNPYPSIHFSYSKPFLQITTFNFVVCYTASSGFIAQRSNDVMFLTIREIYFRPKTQLPAAFFETFSLNFLALDTLAVSHPFVLIDNWIRTNE